MDDENDQCMVKDILIFDYHFEFSLPIENII